jgi:hypothetical protein
MAMELCGRVSLNIIYWTVKIYILIQSNFKELFSAIFANLKVHPHLVIFLPFVKKSSGVPCRQSESKKPKLAPRLWATGKTLNREINPIFEFSWFDGHFPLTNQWEPICTSLGASLMPKFQPKIIIIHICSMQF